VYANTYISAFNIGCDVQNISGEIKVGIAEVLVLSQGA
jgi:hypothetical protein